MKGLIRQSSLIAAVCLLSAGVPSGRLVAQRAELRGLASLYDVAAGAVRDTNGDGLADAVVARVIVPADPTVEDVQAAANIAGRLGFETTALTLPIVLKASDVAQPASVAMPILIGRGNAFTKTLVDRGVVDVKALKPGQGLVAGVASPLGGGDGIVVIGGDDEGTLTGANELAANLPRLWGATGARIAQIETQAVRYLKTTGIPATGRGVSRILVDSDRRGIATTTVRVDVPAADTSKAIHAIELLDASHRRGLEPDTLNYTNAAATEVEIWSGGTKSGSATVRRSGLNARTLTPPVDEEGGGRGGPLALGAGAPAPAVDAERSSGAEGETAGAGAGGRGVGGGAATAAADAAAGADTRSEPPSGEAADAGAGRAGEGTGPGGVVPVPIPPKTFDLAHAYSIDGWFGDLYVDLIPDRLETAIVLGDAKESLGAAHIATRLGLETTGVTLPLARSARRITNAAAEPNPILVGRSNDLVQQLVKLGKVRLDDLKPGEGAIQIVQKAFGPATATVVAGADPAGTDVAAMYLARRVPYLWDVTRGSFSLDDLITQAGDFLGVKTGGSQASLAIREVDDVLKTLDGKTPGGKTIDSFDAKVYLEEANPGFDRFLASRIKDALKTANVTVSSQGITDPVTVFEDKIDIPWEVDEFWAKFKSDVLPKVKAGSTVELETRLSESPQVRKAITDQVRAELTTAGAKASRVRVLSAYKQGFLWLTEVVIPELKGKGAKSVHIKIASNNADLTKKYRFYEVPSRWLHELYPADECFERQLGIAKTAFGMELVDDAKDIYALEALNGAGQVVYKATFSPKIAEREYLEKFPGWSRVKVTTGWISATVDGQSAVDARIETDPERFWDVYQTKTLPKIYDNVMKITGNRPAADKQPFHRDLDIEVWMSEPDFRIGVDEEQVSSLESLHEDLYFVTLDFFNAIGRNTTGNPRLAAPGKVFPIIHPERAGRAGQARIRYAGNASTKARIDISYKEKGVERPTRVSRDLTKIDATPPIAVRAVVAADRVSEIELQTEPKDDREALRAAEALENFVQLHAAGLYQTELSYDHVDRLAVSLALKEARSRHTVPNTGAAPATNVRTSSSSAAKAKLPIVTWDHIISPDESEAIVRQLAAYPEVKAYKAGHSYRGRDISVMEITLPTQSELISVAKYAAYKPTIFITGRQHANEVSSTSHILKLAELLATDPAYKSILKKVNVILHPVENPDGAQMAFELQKLTPHHMLHAGRYSALGMDVGAGAASGLLPESLVRGKIWREWLPDIYLNPHGYPSHEWVEQFSGYVPPQFRIYWSSRGWYTQLSGVRDPRYPDLMAATEALREAIVREINSNSDVRAMDLTHQARYRRWAYSFGPFIYGQEIYKDTAIYFTDLETGEARGSRRVAAAPRTGQPAARAAMSAWPQVTFNVGMTEAPDETAQGEWLNLVTKAGFSFLMAHVKFLRDGDAEIERIEEAGLRDAVSLTLLRVRPVRPARAPAPARLTTSNGGK
jgi:murein tripeptide amidase MpaA